MLRSLTGRFGEIRPARPPAPVNRARIYRLGLIGVATLTGFAWINNRAGVATAFLVALVLGLLFVAAQAHRALLTTTVAIVWWIATAPVVGIVSAAGVRTDNLYPLISQATATNIGLGIVVWLTAVLTRAPRPASTVLACWFLNVVVVTAASLVFPDLAWAIGYVVTGSVLIGRSGLLTRRRRRVSGHTSGDAVVHHALDHIAPSFAIHYGLRLDGDDRQSTVVAGPTGTFVLTALVTDDTVRPVSLGTRLAVGRRRLDSNINGAALTAIDLEDRIRTPVLAVLVVDGPFPDGQVRVVAEPRRGRNVEVLVVRVELVADRLAYGPSILTSGQVSRIMRRIGRISPTVPSEPPLVSV